MRINGKRYETTKARKIYTLKDESLYKKRTGEYFIFNEATNKITPISLTEAKKWLYHADNISFKEEFEEEGNVVTSISLKKSTMRMLEEIAVGKRCDKSKVIEDLIVDAYEGR